MSMLPVEERVGVAFTSTLDPLVADGVTVERNRTFDPEIDQRPLLVVQEQSAVLVSEDVLEARMRKDIALLGYVLAEADDDPAPLLYGLAARATRLILADRTLGGIADDVQVTETDPDFSDEDSHNTADFVALFRVDYATRPGDPFVSITDP